SRATRKSKPVGGRDSGILPCSRDRRMAFSPREAAIGGAAKNCELPYCAYPTCMSVAAIFCLTLPGRLTIVRAQPAVKRPGLTQGVCMWGKRLLLRGCAFVVSFLVFAPLALFAQSASTGLVTGVVTGPSVAAI